MKRTLATARRVLQQLSHDRRSVVMIVLLPSFLITLFRYIFDSDLAVFARVGPQMLGLFPFIVMFLVTSITMVRERTSGTLERLMTTPLGRGELISGYAVAFGLAALVQSAVSTAVAVWLLDLNIYQPWTLLLFAVLDALLGTSVGLLTSAFAVTEFQAVQFMQVVVFPQILLSGLIAPRDSLPGVLGFLSDLLPLSYATDAFTQMANVSSFSRDLTKDLVILVISIEVAVVLASTTLRRRTS